MQSGPDEQTELSGATIEPAVVDSGAAPQAVEPASPNGAAHPEAAAVSQTGHALAAMPPPEYAPLLPCPNDFRAALLVVIPGVPLFACIAAVAIYVIPQGVALASFLEWVKPNALIAGVVAAVVTALVVAALHCWMAGGTAADHANSSAYSQLVARFRELEARLAVVEQRTDLGPSEQFAWRQARAMSQLIRHDLGRRGARWVLGTGYVNLWALVHRAEEALLLVQPVEDVLRAAIYDDLRLQGSEIVNNGDLLVKLRLAVAQLAPDAGGYFAPQANTPPPSIVAGEVSSNAASSARAALAQVRQSINEFRDGNWGALARTRNHLLGTITATGTTTFLLLALAIAVSPRTGPADPFTDPIVAAAAFYLVGSIVGLFNRLYKESASDSSVEDYGLTMARLGLTPILAGMAALGGVLIVAMLPAVMSNGVALASNSAGVVRAATSLPLPSLIDIYSLTNNPFGVIFAAIFGLSPALLLSSLQEATDKYRSSLKSTTPAAAH
jgi:hypothetical protein